MRNISKKTRKKINKILLSNHFKKKLGVTQDTLVYTPNPESPLSAIWHHIEIRYDGTIFGYLLDDKVKYAVIGSVNRKRSQYTNIPDGVMTTCPHCGNVTIVREVKTDE